MNQSWVGESGKVGWVASLMRQLLREVHHVPVGVVARARVAKIHDRSVSRLEQRLARHVIQELEGIAVPFCGLERLGAGLGAGRVRSFNRVDRLLDHIETAQFGQQRQRQAVTGEQKVQADDEAVDTAEVELCPELGDFVKDFVRFPEASAPKGSVALEITCDVHSGWLMRLWMSRQAKGATLFGGEGRPDAWEADTSGRGAVLVACTQRGCGSKARLTNDWLVARLRQVETTFEAGKGLPMAWVPLSQVGELSPRF
jgi:hypothetical protein